MAVCLPSHLSRCSSAFPLLASGYFQLLKRIHSSSRRKCSQLNQTFRLISIPTPFFQYPDLSRLSLLNKWYSTDGHSIWCIHKPIPSIFYVKFRLLPLCASYFTSVEFLPVFSLPVRYLKSWPPMYLLSNSILLDI